MANESIIQPLPAYPSTHARKSLSPSQLASINQKISASLLQTIALPPLKRDTPATRRFVASFAKDAALQVLHSLIWDDQPLSAHDRIIRERTILLAEKLASAPGVGLEIQSLMDLAIVCASTMLPRIKPIFAASVESNPSIVAAVERDLVPAFIPLLSPAQGLYAIRKVSHCIVSILSSSPPELVRCFARSKRFIITLASLYDQGLASIAGSYGGISVLRNIQSRQPDDWELIWVQTKVAFIDAFHVLICTLLDDFSNAEESERTFDIMFALLDLPRSAASDTTTTPFLDQPLLTDYQGSYTLSKTLSASLRHAVEKDARFDLLESTLQSLNSSSTSNTRDPGILKILLGPSGVSPGLDSRGNGSHVQSSDTSFSTNKGKGKAPAPSEHMGTYQVPDLDLKVTQVLDIFTDHDPSYIRALLEHSRFGGNPERVIDALLEGTAPSLDGLRSQGTDSCGEDAIEDDDEIRSYIRERRNIFDDEAMDLSRVRVGKKSEDASILQDRTFIEQMKADILRRAEEMSDDDDEDEAEEDSAERGKDIELDFEEDELGTGAESKVRINDGEDDQEGDDDEVAPKNPPNVEAILELAYIRDAKLFDRDAATRRSKSRRDLKAQTGYEDEQIEGWRIMLERNPHKDKILAKHEFSGNRNQAVEVARIETASGSSHTGGPHRGRGGRGRGGKGRGGGSRGGAGQGRDENTARERAWKDKTKASRGNHNRKRGHDRKMARGGQPT